MAPSTGDHNAGSRSVVLIGLRGAGKTTVGRELAAVLGGEFADTDELVARGARRCITEIFALEGEAGFRRRERAVIVDLVARRPAVIALGGGAVLDARNVRDLRAAATLVWLTAPPEVLWERVTADAATGASRPPLTAHRGVKELEQLLAERMPIYARAADATVDTAGKSAREVAAAIAELLERGTGP